MERARIERCLLYSCKVVEIVMVVSPTAAGTIIEEREGSFVKALETQFPLLEVRISDAK